MKFDIHKIRADFPILGKSIYDKPLIYFDNGATTQKPKVLIDFISDFYLNQNSSIHRGVHYLSQRTTEEYEKAREKVKNFINARDKKEIIFTSGATGSINMFASSFGNGFIEEGDEIIITQMEHHSNIVPWQLICEKNKAQIKVLPVTDNGELEIEKLENLITKKTKLITVMHVSNMLGTINDIKKISAIAKKYDIVIMADGAQAIQHGKVDVQDLGVDLYAFSGHKVFAPLGIGVLYGREEILEKLPPYQGGGDMVDRVTFEKTTFNELPFKFEAGTTNYVGAIGLGITLDYLKSVGIENIVAYEKELMEYGQNKIISIGGLTMYGRSENKIPTFSFLLDNIHPYDAGMVLDKMGIAVRTGTHCTQPLMQRFGIDGTIRASLAFYNTKEEIDQLVNALTKVKQMFG